MIKSCAHVVPFAVGSTLVSREGDVPALRQIKPCARMGGCGVIQAQVLPY